MGGTNILDAGFLMGRPVEQEIGTVERFEKEGPREFKARYLIDQYNKLWKLDPQYNFKQFKIAEKYLNILSVAPASEEVERQKEELKKMQERLAKLEAIYSERLKIKSGT